MPSTAMQGLPYPASNASNDVSVDMKLLGEAVEKQLVQVYATQAALTAANPSPTNGQVCFITADNEYYVRANGLWKVLFKDTEIALSIVAGTGQYSPAASIEGLYVNVDGAISAAANGSLTPAIAAATWTTIATLPVGYRPKKYQYYPGVVAGAVSSAANAGLRVSTSGAIEVFFPAATTAYMSLTGIRFRRSLT